MIKHLTDKALLFGLVMAFYSSIIYAADAELYWIKPGAENQIMSSDWNGQLWSEPRQIYKSKNSLTSLATVTDLDGAKVLVWSERFRTSVVLMKMQRGSGASQWSTAALFSDFGKENMASSMVVDRTNQIWLFWSAVHGDLADIYLLRRSKRGWSEPEQVNSDNQVPDIRPQAGLDLDGNVSVSWQSYSTLAGRYLASNRLFELEKSPQTGYKTDSKEVAEISLGDISLPEFLPNNVVALIHYPVNRLRQSERLEINRPTAP